MLVTPLREERFSVDLWTSEVALLIDALWQAEVVLRDIDDSHPQLEFISDLREAQRNLALRFEVLVNVKEAAC